jgi:group I intron endonuclease
MGYIYTITNKTDNKIYVGQTVRELETRWKDHLKKRSNCRYLHSALTKYGVDNFVFKLVCITFDNQLDDMEIKYIEQYNSLAPNGYNLRRGGNSGTHHAETKQKISETLKMRYENGLIHSKPNLGKPHSEITKKKLSEANKGKPKSEIMKKKLSEAKKGKRRSQESINKMIISRRKNKIIQFDIEGNRLNSFDSCKEAGEYIGTSLSSICMCCNGHLNTVKGFVWKYESIL